jgi:RNA polymerase primary sigma factor
MASLSATGRAHHDHQGQQLVPHRANHGDVEARNRIVQANLRLVLQVARQYVNRGLTLEDLVGEGNLGLIRAAQEYDPGVGTRFSTYATYWIREAILSALANTATTIRLPWNVSKMLGRWRRTEKALYHVHGHPPTFEEVASAMGLDRPTRRLMAQAQRVARIQKEDNDSDESGARGLHMLADGGTPEDSLAAAEEQASVNRQLARLGVTERTMLVLKYGLMGEPPMNFEQIGGRLGMSATAVQKRVSRAMRKLSGHPEPQFAGHGSAYRSRVG